MLEGLRRPGRLLSPVIAVEADEYLALREATSDVSAAHFIMLRHNDRWLGRGEGVEDDADVQLVLVLGDGAAARLPYTDLWSHYLAQAERMHPLDVLEGHCGICGGVLEPTEERTSKWWITTSKFLRCLPCALRWKIGYPWYG